ncbi:hypothetical protein H2200_005752 [Cladophialophora chaetospira]|uniref:Uncharacterized protein n=1 Tax=Cladophialophora chaetospira TaxID=386627 RepID=A0AA38X9T7_9EURO|nr:hypothetical protein H2200_005752 [Cladophialophora chaetospira]
MATIDNQTSNVQEHPNIPVTSLIPAFVGASFPTSPSDPTPNELVAPGGILQLAVPQMYPLGQHPPPTLGEHVAQPLAQLPVGRVPGAVIPLPLGATMKQAQ